MIKTNNILKKQLIVVLKENGFLELDFEDAKEKIEAEQIEYQDKFLQRFNDDPIEALLFLGLDKYGVRLSPSINFIKSISSKFSKKLIKTPDIEDLRDKVNVKLEADEVNDFLENAPFLNKMEYLDFEWIGKFWESLNKGFSRIIKAYDKSVSDFFSSYNKDIQLAGRVFFHLVESKKDDYPFAFMATYSTNVAKDRESKHLPLKNALVEFGKNSKKLLGLLSTVNKASQRSSLIAELIESGEIFHPIGLTAKESYTFLTEIPLYEESGILCRIPNWWKNRTNSLKMSLSVGNAKKSILNKKALVDFDARVSLGDESLDVDELKKLLSEAEGLAFIKGKWVEVNHKRLEETLKAYEQAQKLMQKENMTMLEAMRFQLDAKKALKVDTENCDIEITNGEWMESVIENLKHPEKIEKIDYGKDFHAQLRPYQEKGVSWLNFMKNLGLGACLADDMGLGKTVQIIALLSHVRAQRGEKALLVIPASLMGNWKNEILKFCPKLKFSLLHPSENKNIDNEYSEIIKNHDLLITTYAMLSKYEWIKEVNWDSVILDEAQAIKNPGTKQTRTVKQLKTAYRIAMTGTPIENRLSDLWSLFDFLNKGLLGSPKEFSEYTKKLKESEEGFSKLKKVVSPFILRRLKTDKTVISDLPDKVEMKTYSNLSKKQVAFYKSLVNELEKKLESADEGIQKKGLVLSYLMRFKQLCNHPDQYLGQSQYAQKDSGKYERLAEICETIYKKRERVLIFTQFKEITEYLKVFLDQIFEHEGLVLHGSTPVNKRKDIVDKFQGDDYVPFMVLSIKAGGVGLNLTAANHVVHFDRWWNPAVENQATDRAFRIGQKKSVIVHKFITKGTIEEKIDDMIEEKMKLSGEIISDSKEELITQMDNKELIDLFRLKL